MAKRRPENQLNQNNWDEELQQEDVGHFKKADDDEIKNRVIRVAKRRITRSSDETDGDESGTKPASVFSAFSGFSNKSSSEAATAPSKPMFSFGSNFSSQPSSVPFASTLNNAIFGGSTASKTDDISSSTNVNSPEFITKLKELNVAVLNCIKGHIDSGKSCILTPVFKDYEKYIKELQEDDKKSSTVSSSPAKVNNVTSTASTGLFSFGANKSNANADGGNSLAATTPTKAASVAPMFSFGKPAAATATATTFGAASSGFSFSSAIQTSKPPADSDNTNGNTENADDENDEPPKVEFKPVVEEESIYSKRCKVFVKDSGDFKERGTGTIYLKKVKDDKVQLIVRADTNLGNILLNFLLTSAGPPKLLKNNVLIVCVPTPESDASKPKSVLIRVKTQDDANELLQEIEKYQK